jgi:hypothetical protein
MKEFKSVKPGWTDRKAHQSQFVQQSPPRTEAAMQTDAPIRRAAGRLSREDQRRLGDILQRVYDDVIRQGIPDRFRDLLDELDDAGDTGQVQATTPASHGQDHGQGAGEDDSESDHLVGAKGLDNPGSKESH